MNLKDQIEDIPKTEATSRDFLSDIPEIATAILKLLEERESAWRDNTQHRTNKLAVGITAIIESNIRDTGQVALAESKLWELLELFRNSQEKV